nr:C10 family peptidase [uncultured Draconibacterium sp.]
MVRNDFDYNALYAQPEITMSSPSSLRSEVADFVSTVGELYDSQYDCNGTLTLLEDVEDVFQSFLGWSYGGGINSEIDFETGNLDACRVFGSFMHHDLILSRGTAYSGGGHAFLYSGMVYHMYLDDYSMKSLDQLYVNWGWNGSSNGYYAFSNSGGNYDYYRQHVYIEPFGNPGCQGTGGGGGIASVGQ